MTKQLKIGEAVEVTQTDGTTKTLYVESVTTSGVTFSERKPDPELRLGDVYYDYAKGVAFVVALNEFGQPALWSLFPKHGLFTLPDDGAGATYFDSFRAARRDGHTDIRPLGTRGKPETQLRVAEGVRNR